MTGIPFSRNVITSNKELVVRLTQQSSESTGLRTEACLQVPDCELFHLNIGPLCELVWYTNREQKTEERCQ